MAFGDVTDMAGDAGEGAAGGAATGGLLAGLGAGPVGALAGVGVGLIKGIFDAIAQNNAHRKAAEQNMFAFGGRKGVEDPGQANAGSAIGGILSGGLSGYATGQNVQNANQANQLTNIYKQLLQQKLQYGPAANDYNQYDPTQIGG